MFCRSSYTKRCFRGILWPVLFIITCVKQDWRWLMTIGYPSCGPCPAGQGTDADPGTQRGGQGGTGGEATEHRGRLLRASAPGEPGEDPLKQRAGFACEGGGHPPRRPHLAPILPGNPHTTTIFPQTKPTEPRTWVAMKATGKLPGARGGETGRQLRGRGRSRAGGR